MRPLRTSIVAVGDALMSSGMLPDDGQTKVVGAMRSFPVECSSNTPFQNEWWLGLGFLVVTLLTG